MSQWEITATYCKKLNNNQVLQQKKCKQALNKCRETATVLEIDYQRLKVPTGMSILQEWQGKKTFALPHKAAHSISELNLFLYLRISGVSLCGRVFVGFTLTTDPFRVGSCLIASDLIASLENPTEREKKKSACNTLQVLDSGHIFLPSYNPNQ